MDSYEISHAFVLHLNQLFPVNSWFTINAIDKNKPVVFEKKETKTLGYNPNATLSNQKSFDISSSIFLRKSLLNVLIPSRDERVIS